MYKSQRRIKGNLSCFCANIKRILPIKFGRMKVKHYSFVLTIILLLVTGIAFAQCPMCGEAARTSLKEGNTSAKGLNAGILYLLLGPYLMVMAGGIIWFRKRRKAKKALENVL